MIFLLLIGLYLVLAILLISTSVAGTLSRSDVLRIFEVMTVTAILFLVICWFLASDRNAIRSELFASLWLLLAALALCLALDRPLDRSRK